MYTSKVTQFSKKYVQILYNISIILFICVQKNMYISQVVIKFSEYFEGTQCECLM